MKKYKIIQYPANKDISVENLSIRQNCIRDNAEPPFSGNETKRCKCCGKELPLAEFYYKDKIHKRQDTTCRDCRLKAAGILNIGKLRFERALLKKQFRRCSICKQILPLTEFYKNRTSHAGYSYNCKQCSVDLTRIYRQKQCLALSRYHVRQYGLKKGIKNFTEEVYKALHDEILAKRTERYFVDGKGFVTVSDFADYILENYGIPLTTTKKRIAEGCSAEECKLSKAVARSKAHTKGRIKVTDTSTGDVFYFANTADQKLREMFSTSAISRCLKTGEPSKITRLSKYPNPCIIERITNNNEERE